MKNLFLLVFGVFYMPTIAQTSNPAPHCLPSYKTGGGNYINQVSVGTLTNSSTIAADNINFYTFFNNLTSSNLKLGTSYTITVNCSSISAHILAVFIDYNNNNSFLDPGERVIQLKSSVLGTPVPFPASVVFTVPGTVSTGIKRMRVIVYEDDASYGMDAIPCMTLSPTGFYQKGETEDYNVNIISATGSATGIAELGLQRPSVYPNPVNEYLQVNIESIEFTNVKVENTEGKEFPINYRFNGNNIFLDLTTLSGGMYILSLLMEGGDIYTYKIIKN